MMRTTPQGQKKALEVKQNDKMNRPLAKKPGELKTSKLFEHIFRYNNIALWLEDGEALSNELQKEDMTSPEQLYQQFRQSPKRFIAFFKTCLTIDINEAAYGLLEINNSLHFQEELVKRLHSASVKPFCEAVFSFYFQRKSQSVELKFQISQQNLRTIRLNVQRIPSNTSPTLLLFTAVDITTKKQEKLEGISETSLFKSAIEQAPFAVELFDKQGTQLIANKAWEVLTGQDRTKTQNSYNILRDPELQGAAFYHNLRHVFADGNSLVIPFREQQGTGNASGSRYFRTHFFSLKNESGGDDLVVATNEDVTTIKLDQENIHSELRRVKRYLDLSPSILVAINTQGNVIYANKKTAEMFGVSTSEILDKNWFALSYPHQARKKASAEFNKNLKRKAGIDFTTESRLIDQTGNPHRIKWQNAVLHDNRNQVSGLLCIGDDKTKTYDLSKSLQEVENKYHTIFEKNGLFSVILDEEGNILLINQAAANSVNKIAYQLRGRNIKHLLPKNKAQLYLRNIRRVIKTGESRTFEETAMLPGGEFTFWTHVTPISDVNGNIQSVFVNAKNITENKQIEINLKKRQMAYQELIEHASDGIFITDEFGSHNEVNSAACEILGYSKKELLKMNAMDLISREDIGEETVLYKQLQNYEAILYERDLIHKTGKRIPVEISAKKLADNTYQAIVRDISERRAIQRRLQTQNRNLNLLNQIISATSHSQDPEMMLRVTCETLRKSFNLHQSAAFLLQNNCKEIKCIADSSVDSNYPLNELVIHVEGVPLVEQLIHYPIPTVVEDAPNDERLAHFKTLINKRNAKSLIIIPLFANEDAIGCISLASRTPRTFTKNEIELSQNVAEQISIGLARALLIHKNKHISTALEQTADTVIIIDISGDIIYVNPAYETTTGFSRDEAIGRNFINLPSKHIDDATFQKLWQTIESGECWQGRLMGCKKNGQTFTEEVRITPIKNQIEEITHFVSVHRDVTHELELESQLRQSQKMEAIGTLAGGIAHDFNNILTAILGHATIPLLNEELLSKNNPLRKDFENIQQSAERAANLTRQLLAFARKQVHQPETINLNELIVNIDKMLRRLIHESIEFITVPASQKCLVKVDASQFEQVLINLVINARDAMPNGGTLQITTGEIKLPKAKTSLSKKIPAGKYILLTVKDNGCGIPDTIQERIFDPFFTTKPIGKGTGLGLATCFGIITQNKGYIHVKSDVNIGTEFKVYLPVVEQALEESEVLSKRFTLEGKGETVLLVEDEHIVRDLTQRILRECGFYVIAASNGEEALRALRQADIQHLKIAITDMVMPLLGGQELAHELKQIYKDIKILFMSGYSDDSLEISNAPGTGFLQKPFALQDFTAKIAALLEEA